MNKIMPLGSFSNLKDFHMMSAEELKKKYQLDFSLGLESKRTSTLIQKSGLNIIKVSYASVYRSILGGVSSHFAILLWIIFILSVLKYKPFGDPPDSFNLLLAFLIIVILVFKSLIIGMQEYNTIRRVRSVQYKNDSKINVLRDGSVRKVSVANLVVGDIVELNVNDRVPADLRLIQVNNLKLDKSILTGESRPVDATVEKYNVENRTNYIEASNMAFTNCQVTNGTGKGIVVSIGNQSYLNDISNLMRSKKKVRGIEKELNLFSMLIVVCCLMAVFVYVIFWVVWKRTKVDGSWTSFLEDVTDIIVSGIPFGVPITVTLALFLITNRLKSFNILIKNVLAIDTLSSVNVILTDKTGTLTQNVVNVSNVLYFTLEVDVDSCYHKPAVYLGVDFAIRELLAVCYYCNNSKVIVNSIDAALFQFAEKNLSIDKLDTAYQLMEEIEFSSTNKFHVKIYKPVDHFVHETLFCYEKHNHYNFKLNVIMVKGAFDVLIQKCRFILEPNGSVVFLDQSHRDKIQQKMNDWCLLGRRVIVMCKKMISDHELMLIIKNYNQNVEKWFKLNCHDLVFVGMIGFIDPPRPLIENSIKKLRNLGVRVVMTTGDYAITAASLANQVGILTNNFRYDTLIKFRTACRAEKFDHPSLVLTGKDIDLLSKDEWKTICHNYTEIILARCTPTHKLTCVRQFQTNGFCVLMAGDGINDVPALKYADLSIAMGSGSELATEVSNVVLLDNNFSYIYKLILTGRVCFINIRKILLFLIPTCVISQIVSVLLNVLVGLPSVFNNYEMLFLCIIINALPSISLIFEKPEYDVCENSLPLFSQRLVNFKLVVHGIVYLGSLLTFFIYFNFFLYLKLFEDVNVSDLVFFVEQCASRRYCLCRMGENQTRLGNYTTTLDSNVPVMRGANSSLVVTDITDVIYSAQSVSFYTVVVMQVFGNLYSLRTERMSLLRTFPLFGLYRNRSLLLSSVFVYLFTILLLNLQFLNRLFKTSKIPISFYFIPFVYSFIIILIDEIRKLVLRISLRRRYLSKK